MSPGSFSGPIRHTLTALPTPAPAPGTQTPADLLSLSIQLRKKSFLPLHPAAERTERADALEAAVGAFGKGRLDLAADHPGTSRPQHPSLQSWMVSDATHCSPPQQVLNISVTVVIIAPALSPTVPWNLTGSWKILGLQKGEVRGKGDRSTWKNPIYVPNDQTPWKG